MEIQIIYKRDVIPDPIPVIINILTCEGLQETLECQTKYPAKSLHVLANAYRLNDFTGRAGDVFLIYPESPDENLHVFVGLGPRHDLTPRQFQNAGAILSKRIANLNLACVILDLSTSSRVEPYTTVKPFIEGIAIGSYTFSKYFSKSKPFPLGRMTVIIPDDVSREDTILGIRDAAFNVHASNIARRLTDEASNYKTPDKFESLIQDALCESEYQIKTLDDSRLANEKLNLIRAVGRAGSAPPRLMIIESRQKRGEINVGIVGKAITFDSGGLMIKTHQDMPYMHEDVGGAASVVGALSVIPKLDVSFNVMAAIPIAENLIDSNSYRPSDVFITRNGLSVEVNNTDAEGRLLLADSYLYLQDQFPLNFLVDVATLTGAITRALGTKVAGYFTNHEILAEIFDASCQQSQEKFWRMPLEREYLSNLKSEYADIRNDGGEPKAITAALFLQKFIPDHLPWLHLDVGSILLGTSDDPLYGGKMYASGKPAITLIEFFRQLNQHLPLFEQGRSA